MESQMIDLNETNWLEVFKQPLPLRQPYQKNEDKFIFCQVAGRLLGTSTDEDDYFMFLYDLAHEMNVNVYVLKDALDKTISNEMFQSIQKILKIHVDENGLSVNRFVAFLEGEGLIPRTDNVYLSKHLRDKLIVLLNHYAKNHSEGLLNSGFRRVFVDLIKWMFNHLDKWMKESDTSTNLPKVIWYGDASKSEVYFLYYLILIGCDVLIFHPEGTDIFSEIEGEQKLTSIFRYPSTASLIPFPTTRPVRTGTVAFKASKEIEKVLHTDDSLLYKPWQLRSYKPHSVTLKTTYDELFLLMKERALIRPNFFVQDQMVQIPTIFAKILGVSKNRRDYWSKVQEMSEGDLTHSVRTFPFTKQVAGNNHFHFQNGLGQDGVLDPEKIISSNWWKYRELHTGLQQGLASAIARYCANPKLKSLEHEDVYQTQLFLFNQAMDLPNEVLKLLQKFDYSQHVPRIVLFNTENNGTLTRTDAALLLLLNEFGVDIVIFNPPGHNDIEAFIDEKYYDTHWLEEISFNEEFKESSFIQRFFKKIF